MKLPITICLVFFILFVGAQNYKLKLPQDSTASFANIENDEGVYVNQTDKIGIQTGTVLSALDQSEIRDKALISKVLSQYSSNYKFWNEVITLSIVHEAFNALINKLIMKHLK